MDFKRTTIKVTRAVRFFAGPSGRPVYVSMYLKNEDTVQTDFKFKKGVNHE